MAAQQVRTLELLAETFAVARLAADAEVPAWAYSGEFSSVTRTPEELSIVCPEDSVPAAVEAVRGFRCLRIEGVLEFTETGVLESLTRPLAKEAISVFAVSTYNTDYLLLPAQDLAAGLSALSSAGHSVERGGAA